MAVRISSALTMASSSNHSEPLSLFLLTTNKRPYIFPLSYPPLSLILSLTSHLYTCIRIFIYISSIISMAVAQGKVLKRADPSTIQDKFLVGYQGWFTCAGDGKPVGPGHHGWLHWFDKPIPDGGRPNTDVWPDVSSYSPSELYPAPGLKMRDGEPAMLFSSRNAQTVQR